VREEEGGGGERERERERERETRDTREENLYAPSRIHRQRSFVYARIRT